MTGATGVPTLPCRQASLALRFKTRLKTLAEGGAVASPVSTDGSKRSNEDVQALAGTKRLKHCCINFLPRADQPLCVRLLVSHGSTVRECDRSASNSSKAFQT